jgi:hypothetical protein
MGQPKCVLQRMSVEPALASKRSASIHTRVALFTLHAHVVTP